MKVYEIWLISQKDKILHFSLSNFIDSRHLQASRCKKVSWKQKISQKLHF